MKKIVLSSKQNKPSPLVSLCVIFRDNVDTLPKLLASVKGHFDEYVFCDTGSTDGSRAMLETFLKSSRGRVVDFEWCDDFAKARNVSFRAATGRWRMFLDSDDELQQGEAIRRWVTALEEKHPQIQGAFIPYNYDRDEQLFTMRLVKWGDGASWEFQDAIHERLVWLGEEPLEENGYARTKDFGVLHKRKTADEKLRAIRRNAVIARREYATVTDEEYKARLARTIAMELKADGKNEESIPYLEQVWSVYRAIPEGRQAAADLHKIYVTLGDLDKSLEWAKRAGPSYEAITHHLRGEHREALERQARGAPIDQQTTHEGFFTEKAVAPVACAESALELNLPPARIEKILNGVRPDLRHHPVLVRSVERCRAAIDRITILVPGTPQPFNHESGGSMLGGSEEAVVYLTRALGKLGRNVRVYTPLPFHAVAGVDPYGVEWRDFSEFNPFHEHGTLVVWRSAHLVIQILNQIASIVERREQGDESAIPINGIRGSSLWLHDRGLGLPPETAFHACRAMDSVVVLSEHHRRQIIKECGGQDPGNLVTLSNGIVGADFGLDGWEERDPNQVVYSSCPSRGLRVLLDQWPAVKEACPNAKLDLYYDWSMLASAQPDLHADIVARYEAVKHLDVVHHGGVGHAELHAALKRANVWAYSHFENTEVETFCISAVKATAAGATVITSMHGALPEVAPDSIRCMSPMVFRKAIIEKIKNPVGNMDRLRFAARAVGVFDWNTVAVRFSDLWRGVPLKLVEAPKAPTVDSHGTNENQVQASP